jgi:hypothetical protein
MAKGFLCSPEGKTRYSARVVLAIHPGNIRRNRWRRHTFEPDGDHTRYLLQEYVADGYFSYWTTLSGLDVLAGRPPEVDSGLRRNGWNNNLPASEESCIERKRTRAKATDSDGDDDCQRSGHRNSERADTGFRLPGKNTADAHRDGHQRNEPGEEADEQQQSNDAY